MTANEQAEVILPPRASRLLPWSRLERLGAAVAGLASFALALELLKHGAASVLPLLQGLQVEGLANTLGLGWLMAYGVLSGSPVAAISLTFFSGGVLTDLETFTMINGSRLGAAFAVLMVGFLASLRRQRRGDGVTIGVTALLVTASIYLPAMFLGLAVLREGWADGIRFGMPTPLTSFMDWTYGPAVRWLAGLLPPWLIFGVGLGVLLGSFRVFDRALPEIEPEFSAALGLPRLLSNPALMFLLGLAVTAATLSVSVSLSLLVPFALKGYLRREQAIPFIMGANISTFVDTLFASLLLGQPRAFTLVFVEMASVALLSFLVLVAGYRRYEGLISGVAGGVVGRRASLAAFVGVIMAVPLVLLLV